MRVVKALGSLCVCAGSSESSLLPDAISIKKISCAGPFNHTFNILLSTLVDLLILLLIIQRFYIQQ